MCQPNFSMAFWVHRACFFFVVWIVVTVSVRGDSPSYWCILYNYMRLYDVVYVVLCLMRWILKFHLCKALCYFLEVVYTHNFISYIYIHILFDYLKPLHWWCIIQLTPWRGNLAMNFRVQWDFGWDFSEFLGFCLEVSHNTLVTSMLQIVMGFIPTSQQVVLKPVHYLIFPWFKLPN